MKDWRRYPGTAIVENLEELGYTIEAGSDAGRYVVTACGGDPMPLRPALSLPDDVLLDYLATMSRDHQDESDPLFEALSLTQVHVEEQLATVGSDGRNHATRLGVRRDAAGVAEWFVERDEPEDDPVEATDVEASADLVWQAYPDSRELP